MLPGRKSDILLQNTALQCEPWERVLGGMLALPRHFGQGLMHCFSGTAVALGSVAAH